MRRTDRRFWLFGAVLLLCALWPLLPQSGGAAKPSTVAATSVEWAEPHWVAPHASPVRLPLSALEQRFARQFPGHIGRFADARQEWIVRVMNQPTRMLHPASDCFRALGYQISAPRVHADRRGEHWRCFTASGKGRPLKVCERIFDSAGGRWTDASSWYWSALFSRAREAAGPWWAVTHVEAAR